mmetsp:Transcript_67206/g.153939  ORF Transcript_67206/g.153939 Transcript_67206/m.153939 type:complete len:90 (+) Transcript_67206:796-1065(+)
MSRFDATQMLLLWITLENRLGAGPAWKSNCGAECRREGFEAVVSSTNRGLSNFQSILNQRWTVPERLHAYESAIRWMAAVRKRHCRSTS